MSISERLADLSNLDLIEELTRRCDSVAIICLYLKDRNTSDMAWRFKGDKAFCRGLCRTLDVKIQEHQE